MAVSITSSNQQKQAKKNASENLQNKEKLSRSVPVDRVELCCPFLHESFRPPTLYDYKIRFELGELQFLAWRGLKSLGFLKKRGVAAEKLSRSKPIDRVELWTSNLLESLRTVALYDYKIRFPSSGQPQSR